MALMIEKDCSCRNCGAFAWREKDGDQLICTSCGSVFQKETELSRIRAELRLLEDEKKRERVRNLRRQLYERIHAPHIRAGEIRQLCHEIRNDLPQDPRACFYESACDSNPSVCADFLRTLDGNEQYDALPELIDFALRTLQKKWVLPLKQLLERTYKKQDRQLYVQFTERCESEAERLDSGIYNPAIPRDVFVIYAIEDIQKVMELVERLEANGLSCFVSMRNIRQISYNDADYQNILKEAIDHCRSVVFVSSKSSRDPNRDGCAIEIPYIEKQDTENAPGEYRNRYESIPKKYKKPRVEYRLDDIETQLGSAIVRRFFGTLQHQWKPESVVSCLIRYRVDPKTWTGADEETEEEKPAVKKSADGHALVMEGDFLCDQKRFEEAVKKYREAADAGDAVAQLKLGELYREGKHVKKDLTEAASRYHIAAEQQLAEAQNRLGECYCYGLGVTQDSQKAMEWFQKAADSGSVEAAYNLGDCYFHGRGVEPDFKRAVDFYKKAANRSHAEAQYRLGCCFESGKGVLANERAALQWYQKAARMGHGGARLAVGRLREKKETVTQAKSRKGQGGTLKQTVLICTVSLLVLSLLGIGIWKLTANGADQPSDGGMPQAPSEEQTTKEPMEGNGNVTPLPDAPVLKDEAGISYQLNADQTGYVIVRNYVWKPAEDGVLRIPSEYRGKPVLAIDRDAFRGTAVRSVILPNGVVSIGDSAFHSCKQLTLAELPDSLTSIGRMAFADCSALTDVNLPAGITSISGYTFQGCSALTELQLPNSVKSIGTQAFLGCIGLTDVELPDGLQVLEASAFYGCTYLKSMTVPDSVTSIGIKVLEGCTALERLSVPFLGADREHSDSLKYLFGQYAYSTVVPASLTSVTLTSATELKSFAFQNCENLKAVTLPGTLTKIGVGAFSGCTGLNTVVYTGDLADWCGISFASRNANPHGVTKVTVGGEELTGALEIPEGVTSIGAYAFCGISSLTEIRLPKSLEAVGEDAFADCGNVTAVRFAGNAGDWCEIDFAARTANPCHLTGAFYLNGTLLSGELAIPTGVSSIGRYAFCNCVAITSVKLPTGVTEIGEEAFRDCRGINSITLSAELRAVKQNAFLNCSALKTVSFMGDLAAWSGIVFENASANPCYYDGQLLVSGKPLEGQITLPEGLKKVGAYSFYNCAGITSVTVSQGVNEVGAYAFYHCEALEELKLPEGVTSIGDYAFYGCAITELTLPEGVTTVGSNAFAYCQQLKSVKLPSTLQRLEGNAFYISQIFIERVSFAGTLSQWCEIEFSNLYSTPCNDSGAILTVSGAPLEGEITVPETVTEIGAYTFCGIKALTQVNLHENVTRIGAGAFCGSGLTEAVLPGSLTVIGENAFFNCKGLITVRLGSGLQTVEESAFAGCDALQTVLYPDAVQWLNVKVNSGNELLTAHVSFEKIASIN